jgi:hypothetical protein
LFTITFLYVLTAHANVDYIHEVLHEEEDQVKQGQSDDWEGGLTFIAKSSRK